MAVAIAVGVWAIPTHAATDTETGANGNTGTSGTNPGGTGGPGLPATANATSTDPSELSHRDRGQRWKRR